MAWRNAEHSVTHESVHVVEHRERERERMSTSNGSPVIPVAPGDAFVERRKRNSRQRRQQRERSKQEAAPPAVGITNAASNGEKKKQQQQQQPIVAAADHSCVCSRCKILRNGTQFSVAAQRTASGAGNEEVACNHCIRLTEYAATIGVTQPALEKLLNEQKQLCALCDVSFGERVHPRLHTWNGKAESCSALCARCHRVVRELGNNLGVCTRIGIYMCTAQIQATANEPATENERTYASMLDGFTIARKGLKELKHSSNGVAVDEKN